jgi:hypothetical protein
MKLAERWETTSAKLRVMPKSSLRSPSPANNVVMPKAPVPGSLIQMRIACSF